VGRTGRSARWGAALAICLASAIAIAEPSSESAREAAYLIKFAPFVGWPLTAYANAEAPLVICVQGADPFGAALDRVVKGQHVGRHPIIVARIDTLGADSGCHIAYVGGSPAQTSSAALKAVGASPVLTVTDAESRGGGKGIVHLFLSHGRMRFSIDSARAQAAGLSISSKLLSLSAPAPP
jgi:hypothetical protein